MGDDYEFIGQHEVAKENGAKNDETRSRTDGHIIKLVGTCKKFGKKPQLYLNPLCPLKYTFYIRFRFQLSVSVETYRAIAEIQAICQGGSISFFSI